MNSPRGNTVNSLQVLRAYAALSVMVGHAALEAATNAKVGFPFDVFPLLAGVDIFFVISGFIMYHTSKKFFGVRGGVIEFIKRRFVRIVPLYWLMTSLMVGALFIAGGEVRSTEFDVVNIIGSYAFFPIERAGGRIAPVLSLGWTLNYEMFFYAIFAAALFFRKSIGAILVLCLLVFLSLLGLVDFSSIPALKFWTNSVILEFGFGIVLGMLYPVIRGRIGFGSSIAVLLIGFVSLILSTVYLSELPRFLKGGVPAACIVLGALIVPVDKDSRVPAFLVLLGNSSYALYLSHRFVFRVVSILFRRLTLSPVYEVALYVAAVMPIATLVGVLVYKFVEQPLIGRLNSYFLKSKGA